MESVKIMQRSVESKELAEEKRCKEALEKRESRFQKASKILKSLMHMLPTDSGASSLLIYFKSLEELFVQYGIQDDIKILLLSIKLPDRVRKLLGNLEASEKDSYDKVKN